MVSLDKAIYSKTHHGVLFCRLLNMDIDSYAHLNCALWSSEVYETLNGALMNVDVAYKRGLKIECTACGLKGATVGCFNNRCPKYYHLGCAKKVGCMFFQDKVSYCVSAVIDYMYLKFSNQLSVKIDHQLIIILWLAILTLCSLCWLIEMTFYVCRQSSVPPMLPSREQRMCWNPCQCSGEYTSTAAKTNKWQSKLQQGQGPCV